MSGTIWLYRHFDFASKTQRMVLHHESCHHCNDGRGVGGQSVRVDPDNWGARPLPPSAWIGGFESILDAMTWVRGFPLARNHTPTRCGHCAAAPPRWEEERKPQFLRRMRAPYWRA